MKGLRLMQRAGAALWLASACIASAQAPSIEPLGWLDPGAPHSVANGVSSDGTMVCGDSMSASGFKRGFVWTEGGSLLELGTLGNAPGESSAQGVTSASGGIAVGYSAGPYGQTQAFRWTPSGGVFGLVPIYFPTVDCWAYGVSPNGQYVIGSSMYHYAPAFPTPTRWQSLVPNFAINVNYRGIGRDVTDSGYSVSDTLYNSGSTTNTSRGFNSFQNAYFNPPGGSNESFVGAIATNPNYAVGHSLVGGKYVATQWINNSPSFLHSQSVNSYAYDISPDNLVTVGEAATGTAVRGDAYIWTTRNGHSPKTLFSLLKDVYGLDMTGWTKLHQAKSVSNYVAGKQGYVVVGHGEYEGVTTAFRATLPLDNDRPTIATTLIAGQAYIVPLGGTPFSRTLTGSDADNDALTASATGLPPSGVLLPGQGAISASPFQATVELTPTLADVGSHEVTVKFADMAYAGNPATFSFFLNVPANNVPTASAPTPQTIECDEGENVVELSSTVGDADSWHRLTVVWKVNGVVEQTTEDVVPGTTIDFAFNYPHGANDVAIEVSDGYHTGTASSTVTVEDTTSPVVVVAQDKVVSTNTGKAFATGVDLGAPTVTDNCDGEPLLSNDASAKYLLGETNVTWTAIDADGNQATGTQKVTVVDEESPTIDAGAAVKLVCDPGELFSTKTVAPPTAHDNVPAGLAVTSNAPPQFPLGKTIVRWTATDAAGNSATWDQTVTVVNRKPKANPGAPISVTTKSERGATVKLDGSKSSDPDQHDLKFAWTASGVKLKGAKSATPSGLFPIGSTTVNLSVTDEAGAKHSKSVRVTVKLQASARRARAATANDALANAAFHSTRDSALGAANGDSLAGLAYANAAFRAGTLAGDHVVWGEELSPEEAGLAYAELRAAQQTYAQAAAKAHVSAFVDTGDDDALMAAYYSLLGAGEATADLVEP